MKYLKWAIVFSIALFLFSACTPGADETMPQEDQVTPDSVSQATESRYVSREIREYEGVRLDPSQGPRDNSIKGVQNIDIDTYQLKISGLVENPLTLTYDEVLAYPSYERVITLFCVEGWDSTILWKGVKLTDLFADANPIESANTVIFKAEDGYTTSLPLKTIEARDILMAYESNGVILPASLGYPFIIVAEDKYGYKWARWVIEMELSDDEDYKGFWEDRGYSNDAELPPDSE